VQLVWRVKLVAELRPGVMIESEVARIERDEHAGLADLGLRLAETKRLIAALQAEIVPAQVAAVGERRRCCPSCGRRLASKATTPLPSALCSAMCRCAPDAYLSVPVRTRLK